ncbi:hypothetical protein RMSM_00791 [Rhodopirellula maiorica SM1]|uniref:Uncharacterized protein n=1 Tax=Rhodopirellula maiorica SM1 TaxID=1265738 RepID=M5RSJ4_9BACT|nr:hypothetical protein RMSM_00791 [Rhodopirellula maiorica SM1]
MIALMFAQSVASQSGVVHTWSQLSTVNGPQIFPRSMVRHSDLSTNVAKPWQQKWLGFSRIG